VVWVLNLWMGYIVLNTYPMINIALHAFFRKISRIFRKSPHTRAMGRFMDLVYCNTPQYSG